MPLKMVTFHIRRFAAVLYMLMILVVVTCIVTLSARSFSVGKAWVDHTTEAIATIQAVQLTLLNAETGQRGYLLTQNTAYLIPYNDASLVIHRQLNSLRELMDENEVQGARVDNLEVLTNQFLKALKEGVDHGQDKRQLDASKEIMDHIRIVLIKMMNDERVLMNKRLLKVDDATVVLSVCLTILIIRDLLVLLVLMHGIFHTGPSGQPDLRSDRRGNASHSRYDYEKGER